MIDKVSIAVFISILLLLICNHQLVYNHQQSPSSQQYSPTIYHSTQQQLSSFTQWQIRFLKFYGTPQETLFRSQVFMRKRLEVLTHNRMYRKGKTSFEKELNRLADLTEQQFRETFNWRQQVEIENVQGTEGLKKRLKIDGVAVTKECSGVIMDAPNPPAELDWAQTSKVTPSPDQGTCGKDWAIVSTGAVESLYAIKIGQLQPLSIQQLVECSGQYGNEGCYGGFMDQAFWYLIDYGAATVKSYPQRDVSTCRYVQNMKFTGISRCARVPSGNFSKLLSAIVQQPVSVALDFSPDMALYKNGIFDGQCTTRLTHAMLLTGYGGKQHGTHYWILRNTLGPTWGEKGYIHLLKEEKDGLGKCGIMSWPSLPQNLS